MLETIFLILAGVGLLTIFAGRHIMIRDTGGDPPFLWIIALRLLPFSELAYMVRHFSQAKKGAIVSIVGMWLMVPHLSRELWQHQEQAKKMMAQLERELTNTAGGTAEAEQKILAEMPAEFASGWMKRKDELQQAREKKVAELHARIAAWHQQMQAARASLDANDQEAVKRFNEQAAAYARLNAFAKTETELMVSMRPKKAGS